MSCLVSLFCFGSGRDVLCVNVQAQNAGCDEETKHCRTNEIGTAPAGAVLNVKVQPHKLHSWFNGLNLFIEHL